MCLNSAGGHFAVIILRQFPTIQREAIQFTLWVVTKLEVWVEPAAFEAGVTALATCQHVWGWEGEVIFRPNCANNVTFEKTHSGGSVLTSIQNVWHYINPCLWRAVFQTFFLFSRLNFHSLCAFSCNFPFPSLFTLALLLPLISHMSPDPNKRKLTSITSSMSSLS